MVCEHLLGCFILEDPSFEFLELFQVVVVVAHVHILKLMTLMLGVNKLLAMAKDIGGLPHITEVEVFIWFISRSIVLGLQGPF